MLSLIQYSHQTPCPLQKFLSRMSAYLSVRQSMWEADGQGDLFLHTPVEDVNDPCKGLHPITWAGRV